MSGGDETLKAQRATHRQTILEVFPQLQKIGEQDMGRGACWDCAEPSPLTLLVSL